MIGVFEGIEVGAWYLGIGGDPFEVVALDFKSETIEIQYYDGSVAELDYDGWLELEAKPTNGPSGYDGALDMAQEDYRSQVDGGFNGDSDWVDAQSMIDRL